MGRVVTSPFENIILFYSEDYDVQFPGSTGYI